jgi:hypothetical protein
MSRMSDLRDAVRDEAEKFGAQVLEFGFTGHSHQKAVISYRNKVVKLFFAGSPSDRNSADRTKQTLRRVLRQIAA